MVTTLSTGYKLIDQKLRGDGVPEGTLVAIPASPQAPARAFMHNLISDRDAIYISTRDQAQVIGMIHDALAEEAVGGDRQGLGKGRLEAVTLDATAPLENLLEYVEGRGKYIEQFDGFPEYGVVIIDSIDQFEAEGVKYKSFLRRFSTAVREDRCLGVLRGLSGDETGIHPPDGRKHTLDNCEVVLRVLHESSSESVSDRVAVEKVDTPAGFKPDEDDDRIFEVHRENEFLLNLDPNRGLEAGG